MNNIKKLFFVLISSMIVTSYSFGFVGMVNFLDDIYRASPYAGKITKLEFKNLIVHNPSSMIGWIKLSKVDKLKVHIGIAVEKNIIPPSKQTYYLNRFRKIDGGEKLLADALKRNKNLDEVLENPPKLMQASHSVKRTQQTIKHKVLGTVNDFKLYPIYKNGVKVAEGKASDFYNIGKSIQMAKVSFTHAGKTSIGYLRNPVIFWKGYLNKFGDDLSLANKKLISQNRSPIVDETWVKAYPKHRPFMGDTLIHHHVHHGSQAVPLPKTLHVENSKIFHAM